MNKRIMHGMSTSRLYSTHQNMKNRCDNKNTPNYKNYGGRGIKVCDEWYSFQKFVEWAMSNGYTDELTIDRIDSNGNYESSNCRFVCRKVQAMNRGAKAGYEGYIGVSKRVRRFQARIVVEGKRVSIGNYDTPREAAIGRDEYIIKNQLPHTLNF